MHLKINGEHPYFWQWDLNRQLIVEDEVCGEVHFCNGTAESALVRKIFQSDGVRLVNVPNILLQTDKPVCCYLYVRNEDESLTRCKQTFKVLARSKPDDYVYTESEVLTWTALDERVKALEENDVVEVDPAAVAVAVEAYMAEHPVEETDPTVPAWAKAKDKPSYTAQEVGALPDDTEIPVVPTKVSAFENDKGYLTEQNLSGYAKSEDIPTKPSDIGAQPAGNYATKDEIPTTLPNPHKLTINGTSYDGSAEVEVNVEGGGRRYELLATVTTTEDVEMVEITECDDGTPLLAKELLIRTYIAAGTAKCNIWVGSTCYRWLKGADGIFRDIKQCTWYDSIQHINGIDTSKVDRWTKLIHHYKKDVGVMYEKWKSVGSSNTDVFEMYDGVGLKRLNSTYYAREEGFDHVYVKTNNVATQPIPAGSEITVYGVRA